MYSNTAGTSRRFEETCCLHLHHRKWQQIPLEC